MMLRTHSQTSGWSLTEQDPYNNVIRTTIEAMAAGLRRHPVAAHQRSRRSDRAADRVLGAYRPQHADHHPGRNQDLQRGRSVGRFLHDGKADPGHGRTRPGRSSKKSTRWAAWSRPSNRLGQDEVETCAAETQALIDSGKKVIVGVNKYKLAKEDPIDILDIDNHAVRESQIASIKKIRETRDSAAVRPRSPR